MTNNEKFCQRLNACADPERVLAALLLFAAKPSVQQAHDMCEKRQVVIRELLPLTDVAHGHQRSSCSI